MKIGMDPDRLEDQDSEFMEFVTTTTGALRKGTHRQLFPFTRIASGDSGLDDKLHGLLFATSLDIGFASMKSFGVSVVAFTTDWGGAHSLPARTSTCWT